MESRTTFQKKYAAAKPAVPWKDEDELKLKELQGEIDKNMGIEDIQFGRDRKEKILEARSFVMGMATPQRRKFLRDAGMMPADDESTENLTSDDTITACECAYSSDRVTKITSVEQCQKGALAAL